MRTELAPFLGKTKRWTATVDRISTRRGDTPYPIKTLLLRNIHALDESVSVPHVWVTAPNMPMLWPGDHIEFTAVVIEYQRGYHLDRCKADGIDYGISMPTRIHVLEEA